jgi:outer membrane protein assembly factor BamB
MPSPGSRRWRRRGLAAVAVLVLLAGGAVAFVLLHAPGNVSHPNVDFTTSTVKPPPRKPQPVSHFRWPFYGGDETRTHFLADKLGFRFRVGWKFEDYVLLEFPPVMSGTTLYLLDNYGSAKAIDSRNGRKLWETSAGRLAAASPGLDIKDGLMFVPLLSVSRGANLSQRPGNGAIKALRMSTGKVVWSRSIPPGSESSPLVVNGIVYTGSQNGTVYALHAKTGKPAWIYHASGAVKGGPAYADGKIYFGDYAGRMYALNARNGRPAWVVGTSGTAFGFGSGTFYSSPAVAFGRVFIGNTDNFVYSFSARTGQLAWRTGTGHYVYSSPAVEDTPGLGPTVYIGSYDGRLYALNARSGAVRWSHSTGGAIDGSPQIIGGVVYVSDLRTKKTYGFDARTGKTLFTFPDGRFNPGISDGHALYFTGYSKLYQLLPVVQHQSQHKPNRRRTKR